MILHYHSQGYKPYTIAKVLKANEGLQINFGVAKQKMVNNKKALFSPTIKNHYGDQTLWRSK